MSARALLEEYYRVVWTEGDLGAIERFFAPTARAGGILPPTPVGPEDLRVMAQTVRGIVSRPRFRILRFIEDGDWASVLCVVEGRIIATGEPLSVQGQIMYRIVDDLIVEAHNNFDMLAAYVQTGALPPDAEASLLGGHALH